MKLSKKQIEELYAFVRKKGIEFIDLQNELVDHLANGVEAQWEENPTISFDDALKTEYRKFGIFGFDDVLMEKMKSMEIRGLWLYLKKLKQFFKIPRIIFTLSLVALFYYLSANLPFFEYVYFGILVLSAILVIYFDVKTFKEVRILSKKYLVARGYNTFQQFSYWIIYTICMIPIWGDSENIIQKPLLTSFLLSIAILEVLVIYELSNELKNELRDKHNYIFEG